jgi:hypothetical protein
MSKTRKVFLLLMILGAGLGYLGLKAAQKSQDIQPPVKATTNLQQAFINRLVSAKKSPIKAAMWVTPTVLQVGVTDDHTLQFRLAESVCSVAKQNSVPAKLVKVIDIAKLKRSGKVVELGQAYCN